MYQKCGLLIVSAVWVCVLLVAMTWNFVTSVCNAGSVDISWYWGLWLVTLSALSAMLTVSVWVCAAGYVKNIERESYVGSVCNVWKVGSYCMVV